MNHSDRQGFALPLALAGIVLVGILAASGLYLAAQERRAGENGALADRALAAAELGVGTLMEGWSSEEAAALPVGGGWHRAIPAPGAFADVALTRLAQRTYWAVAEGRASRGGSWARRRVNAVLRVIVPQVTVDGAVMSARPLTIAPGASVSGTDTVPCAAGGAIPDQVAGIAVPVAADAAGDLSDVDGAPPVLAAGGGDNHIAPGGLHHAWIAERATAVLEDQAVPRPSRPSVGGDECDSSDPGNWGEPREAGLPACRPYRRVVHARGDLTLEGEHLGQGILLVDGDLAVPGRLLYRGLLIVHGALDVQGQLIVEGAVVIGGGSAAASWLGPGSVVQYRRCEIDRALTSAGRPIIARERGWADLF
jgi:hypothetical protein